MRAWALAIALLVLATSSRAWGGSPPAERTRVRIILAEVDNLQDLAFWVAKGAGYFGDEGIDLELSVPTAPRQTAELVRRKDADVSVLSPPVYLELLAEKEPIVLVANLLQNDPINLIVRRSVMEERKLSRTMPLGDRLRGLKGLKLGIAPNPPVRLRTLFSAYGLDADKDIDAVILHGPEQNYAFGDHRVDALYAHTPYLETALCDQDAVLLVDQSGGEVAQLAGRQIHALLVTQAFAASSPGTVTSLVRAVYRAEQLIHTDHAATVQAILHEFPTLDRRHIDTLVTLYEPAVPRTPQVSADGLLPALALFPASRHPPDFSGVDLAACVAPRFADELVGSQRTTHFVRVVAPPALVAVVGLIYLVMRRRRAPSGEHGRA